MSKEIQLTKGQVAIVDDAEYERASQFKWTAYYDRDNDKYYAIRQVSATPRNVSLASFILNVPQGTLVDHISGNTLDNQRINLRVATYAQNNRNRRKSNANTSSRYKGVCWDKRRSIWVCSITYNGLRKYLGSFTDELVAAKVYDKQARELFGEFARCNFPLIGD